MTPEDWTKYLEKTKKWNIRMSHELLHSRAYTELSYAPSLKLLNWFYEKIEIKVNRRKRGAERYKFVNNGDIDFEYLEAKFRGLSHQQFRRALLDLHKYGFIEVARPGSVLKEMCTLYSLSDRWKKYGTSEFEDKEYPKSVHWINCGFGGLVDPEEARKKRKAMCENSHLASVDIHTYEKTEQGV